MSSSSEKDFKEAPTAAMLRYALEDYKRYNPTNNPDSKLTLTDFIDKYKLAFNYYAKSGYEINSIPSHLKGIDFRYKVEVSPIPPPHVLQQLQVPNGRQGAYYSLPGAAATELGIAPEGRLWDSKNQMVSSTVMTKTPIYYDVVASDLPVLKTTAAAIEDDWSLSQPYLTKGGASQIFCSNQSAFSPQSKYEEKQETGLDQEITPASPKAG